MRGLLFLLPAMLWAQASSTTPPTASPKSSAAKPTAARTATSKTGPARPAAAKPKSPTQPPLMTDDDKTIYALGLSMYRSLAKFDLTPKELDIVKRAISDAMAKKPELDLDTWSPKIEPLVRARSQAAAKVYLDKAASEPGAVKTASGLIYREVRPGSGGSPKATDTVKVNYRGTLVDGTEFDSSYKRNEPAEFPLSNVIRCWTEGVQKMQPGGKAILVCPSSIAYGDRGQGPIPGGATLIFEIELLEIAGAKP